jgi:hypothetical protein
MPIGRIQSAFLALILAQTAHSIEEYVGRLWESFPPAAFLTGLVSANREVGFVVLNVALVAFGFWCYLVPVRRDWESARAFMWFWAILETINGIGHIGWSIAQASYTPGVLTAPFLLAFALLVAAQMRQPQK